MRFKYRTTSAIVMALAISGGAATDAHANGQDAVVTQGAATISESGKNLSVNQTSDKVLIDWRTFNIAPDEHTNFIQPNSSSLAVNRVNADYGQSQILGKLSANGNIVIINGSGIMFGAGSQVDVNGLVATTSDIDNADLAAGQMNFTKAGKADASVIKDRKSVV